MTLTTTRHCVGQGGAGGARFVPVLVVSVILATPSTRCRGYAPALPADKQHPALSCAAREADVWGSTWRAGLSSAQRAAPHICTNSALSGTLQPYDAVRRRRRNDIYAWLPRRFSLGRCGTAVLSIGKLTVEQSRYYERQVAQERDDYYSGSGESPGRWTGAGAETLRAGGRVDDDDFMALMEGRDPRTGERLKRVGGRSKVVRGHQG